MLIEASSIGCPLTEPYFSGSRARINFRYVKEIFAIPFINILFAELVVECLTLFPGFLRFIDMKKIYTAILLLTASVGAYAQAEHKENCDRAEYAQQYAAGFNQALNGALDKFKDQDKSSRAKLDGMKAALIKAGAWTDAEASVFMIKASMTDENSKVLEAERKKAANDFKVQLLSLEGIPMIVRGSKAEELRAICLLGPNAISKADVLYTATERAWQLLESKVAEEARAKNVILP